LVKLLKENSEIEDRVVYSEFRGADYNLLPGIKNVPSRMMKKGNYKFVYTHSIVDQLYNLKEDPDELNNLIFSKEHQNIYKDMYFQTLADWRFQEYNPIEVELKNNMLAWSKSNPFDNYTIYFSKTKDFMKAEVIQEAISENQATIHKKGYYWLTAKQKLTKTSKFYGSNVPVAVEKYSKVLPVSNVIEFN